jgi:hypothetical protein
VESPIVSLPCDIYHSYLARRLPHPVVHILAALTLIGISQLISKKGPRLNTKSLVTLFFFFFFFLNLGLRIVSLLFQGSSAISSADLFGHSDDQTIDLAASDLINRISFQV